jgi:hypothetical protein
MMPDSQEQSMYQLFLFLGPRRFSICSSGTNETEHAFIEEE